MTKAKQKKLAQPVPPDALIQEQISGPHPVLGHRHVLTRYANGLLKIERDDLVTRHPLTGQEERQSFETLLEPFEQHGWLWHFIQQSSAHP